MKRKLLLFRLGTCKARNLESRVAKTTNALFVDKDAKSPGAVGFVKGFETVALKFDS